MRVISFVKTTIDGSVLWLRNFDFPLLALRRRLLDFPRVKLISALTLALAGGLCIQWPGITVGTTVFDFANIWNRSMVEIITLDMLPSFTSFAVNGASIVILKPAYTLDSIIFLLVNRQVSRLGGSKAFNHGRRRRLDASDRINSKRGMRFDRRMRICHTMTWRLLAG